MDSEEAKVDVVKDVCTIDKLPELPVALINP
jgi:hypothetical protein